MGQGGAARGGTRAGAILFALAYLLAHAAAARWAVLDASAVSFAFLIVAPLLAGIACAARARRGEAPAEWNAMALAMLLWSAGMAVCMYEEEFRANPGGTPALGMLLFLLYGVPLAHALTGQQHDVRAARLVDGVLAVVLGALFAVHTFSAADWAGASEVGAVRLRQMFDIENGFLLLFALLSGWAALDAARRRALGVLSLFAFAYAGVAAYINHADASAYGQAADLLIDMPFLLLMVLALWPAAAGRDRRADHAFPRFIRAASPLVLPVALLIVAGFLARTHLGLAIAGFAVATLGHGLRSVLVQLHAARERERLDALARIDALTGLANRRSFDDTLLAESQRARRSGGRLALLLLDIDHFKQLNDGLGHPAGDACLREVARVLASCVQRGGDMVARYGGEEFAVILPGTSASDALDLAERMRLAVRALALPTPAPEGRVTISAGVGLMESGAEGDAAVALLQASDAALYEAKRLGRDRVVLSGGAGDADVAFTLYPAPGQSLPAGD